MKSRWKRQIRTKNKENEREVELEESNFNKRGPIEDKEGTIVVERRKVGKDKSDLGKNVNGS